MTATQPRIAVAGSGLAGLHCAIALSASAEVTVYERLPVSGGEHWEDPAHARLIREARDQDVRFAAGTQVVRWEGDCLLAVGEHGGLTGADALVVATGHRPATRSELRIDGDRSAGVVPATLALHLIQQRVALGANVVVAGESHWAAECIAAMASARRPAATITWVGHDAHSPHRIVTALPGARVTATHGMPRITGVTIESAGTSERLACDCLILAGPPVPYRNIDGAVLDQDPAVFAQRDVGESEPSEQIGLKAAVRALADAKAPHRSRIPVEPRIGLPR